MATTSSFSKHSRGPLLKARFTIAIFLFCYFLLGEGVDGSTNEKHVYTGEVPAEDAQRISILIGKSGEGEENNEQRERLVGINQDEGGGGDNSTGGVAASESTTHQMCGTGSNCCYQYTWPSDRETTPAPSNATCEYLKKKNKADDMACFDPLVFTRPAGTQQQGTPPNFTDLVDKAITNNWNIFCPMTGGKNCVTYTYYSRDGSTAMTNQTKFCGIVTNKNSGRQISSGCYKEEVDGYIREVCVCSRHVCNGQSSIVSRSHVGLLSILIITAAAHFNIVNKLLS